MEKEIRVKVNNGYLVAGRNADPNYDGIYICFEANEGTVIDIAVVEAKSENDKKKIDVYTWADVYTEEYTDKFTISTEDIYKALDI